MAPIDSRQIQELTDALRRNEVQYLYIGKSAAIIHGFADTTQDADIYVRNDAENRKRLLAALKKLGFALSAADEKDVERGKDFVQLHGGPFDLDLIYAPDGIEHFDDAWTKGRSIDGHHVCSMEDVIASKRAANRLKDRESLGRLEDFLEYLKDRPARGRRLPPLEPAWRDRMRQEADPGAT